MAQSIWMAGCGNMGAAMLHGWLASGMSPRDFTIIRPSGTPVTEGVSVVTAPPAGAPDILILAMKPYQLAEAAPAYRAAAGPETILVSILAGTEAATLRALFPEAKAIIRAMPNLPVRLRAGVTALYAEDADAASRETVTALMERIGAAPWLDSPREFDALMLLAGSGPAFVYRFIAALAKAGAAEGLDPALAERMALATVSGAAALAGTAGEPVAGLADKVASKGGVTRAGLDVLDADAALDRLVRATIAAGVARAGEMAAEARKPAAPSD